MLQREKFFLPLANISRVHHQVGKGAGVVDYSGVVSGYMLATSRVKIEFTKNC
jgi:hypothetical protein